MAATHAPAPAAATLRVADVALWYGRRSGGIRTYLDAKARYAAEAGAFEHHLVLTGPREVSAGGRHELRGLTAAASNGYRLPLSTGPLAALLRRIRPDVILAHDPFWALPAALEVRDELGAKVVAVNHATSAQEAAELPGPSGLYRRGFERWRRRGYGRADAVMAFCPPEVEVACPVVPMRVGLDAPFAPRAVVEREAYVLYVGRISRAKGLFDLLHAAAASAEPWPLRVIGTGPAQGVADSLVRRLGLGDRVRFLPFVEDRAALADEYARASCVVMPGRYETFGFVAFEAAACGARVVACETAPSAALCGPLVETFAPGDTAGLLRAIERSRAAPRDVFAAARMVARHGWGPAIEAELRDLARLCA